MTTIPAPGADLATELPRAEQVLRRLLAYRIAGALLYADDGELQDNTAQPFIDFRRDSVDAIETKLGDRSRATLAAVPASEPVGTVYYERVNDEFHVNLDYDRVKDGDQLFLAAPAPVSGMPDRTGLSDTRILEIAAQYEHGWADDSGITPYSPDEDEGRLFVKLIRALLADVERLLNPAGETK